MYSAAADPAVLAIKLTIYRTGRRSPIIQVLKEAARRGKQVAVLVEITARFAPVCDPVIKAELENILHTYEDDNCSAWDMQPDGEYIRRHPAAGEAPREAQQVFIERSAPR